MLEGKEESTAASFLNGTGWEQSQKPCQLCPHQHKWTDSKSLCPSTIFQATTPSSFKEVPQQILPHKGLPSIPTGMLERGKEGCQEDSGALQALLTPFLTVRWTNEHTADLGPKQPQNLPLIRKKKTPVSLATARAISVLPVPGGPYSRIPRGG